MRETDTFQLSTDQGIEVLELREVTVRVSSPSGPPVEISLGLSPLRVGTATDCDVVLSDPSVSRHHLELSLRPEGVRVRDLDSKNGTLLQGAWVRDVVLRGEGEVTLGGSKLSVLPRAKVTRVPLGITPKFGEALGGSPAMRALFALLTQAAQTDASILLNGETGTGKELLARAVHEHSPRHAGPFVVVDCGAVAPTLIEAELFGYRKGAFTGANTARTGLMEQAHGGTLFVDEIGEMPLELQARLLRVIETKTVRPVGGNDYRPADARIVAATHRDLRGRVASRTFREDLYFRLAVIVAAVPPLRERRDDIPLLVSAFLARQSPPRSLDEFPPNLIAMLSAHLWPGNVRELLNTVTRLSLFPAMGLSAIERAPARSAPEATFDSLMTLPWKQARDTAQMQFELAYLRARLKASDNNVSAAAKSMGISRQFLYRLLDTHGLTPGAPPDDDEG